MSAASSSTPSIPSPPIYIKTLGEFQLLINGQDCTALLNYEKARLALTIVALSKQAVTRANLAEMLWPKLNPDKGKTRVRHALHLIRQAFHALPEALIITATHVKLCSNEILVDLLDFLALDTTASISHLKEKLDLHSGQFLHNLKVPDSDYYLNWLQAWQTHYEMQLSHYRHAVVSHYIERNEAESVLTYVKWWLLQTPEDEACHRFLIRLYLETGDRDAALRAYQHCEKILKDRLNIEPSTETQALIQSSQAPRHPSYPLSSHSASNINLRPIATLALVVKSTRSEDNLCVDPELHCNVNPQLSFIEQLKTHCLETGAFISLNGYPALCAHFGYTQLQESPIQTALELALRLQKIEIPHELSLHLALHASIIPLAADPVASLDRSMSKYVLPLALEAEKNEIRLTAAAAARLCSDSVITQQVHNKTIYTVQADTPLDQHAHTRIYGRMTYFDALIQQWSHYIPGQAPRYVHITGQTGSGKTQLAKAIAEYVRNVDGQTIYLKCQETHTQVAYHPVCQWIRQLVAPLNIDPSLSPEAHSNKPLYQQLKQQLGITIEASQRLLELLFFYASPTYGKDQHQEIQTTLLQVIKDMAQRPNPLCLIWDDIHWIDEPSLRFIELLQYHSLNLPMIISLSRHPCPNFSWQLMHLELKALPMSAISNFLSSRSKHYTIPTCIKDYITKYKIRNPRHIIDILQLGRLHLPFEELPRSADWLVTQLHHLSPTEQEILFLSALIQPLHLNQVNAILDMSASTLFASTDNLRARGVITRRKEHLECPTILQMPLLRLIPYDTKQRLCKAIAHYLIQTNQSSAQIAKYLDSAQSPDSNEWWQKAIRESFDQGQLQEVIEHITRAFMSQKYIVGHKERAQHAFNTHTILGGITIATQGPAAVETLDAYQEAARNSEQKNALQQCTILWGKWLTQHSLGHFASSKVAAEQLQKIATVANCDFWLGWSHYALAQYHLYTGDPETSEQLLIHCITILNDVTIDRNPELDFYGLHSYALAYGLLGLTQATLGRLNSGGQNIQHALALAEKNNNTAARMACRLYQLRLHYLTGNYQQLFEDSVLLASFFNDQDQDSIWYQILKINIHLAQQLLSPHLEHINAMLAIRPNIEQNMPSILGEYLCALGRCYYALGLNKEAITCLDEAQQILEHQENQMARVEILFIRGDIHLNEDRPELAQIEWQKALALSTMLKNFIYTDWFKERVSLVTIAEDSD